jgi:hypothetical protein
MRIDTARGVDCQDELEIDTSSAEAGAAESSAQSIASHAIAILC